LTYILAKDIDELKTIEKSVSEETCKTKFEVLYMERPAKGGVDVGNLV